MNWFKPKWSPHRAMFVAKALRVLGAVLRAGLQILTAILA
jgi:hypothetical protein